MNTKTCKKCGWVYPLETPYKSCRFCGMAFTNGTCSTCGEDSDDIIPGTRLCRKCYNKRSYMYHKRSGHAAEDSRNHYRRICKKADERFAAWKDSLKSITTHSLTEDEWLDACRYFGGCALCDSDSIDARGYFIRFEDGGKYNACNVIPLCDTCATTLKYQSNPFRQMNPYINRNLATSRGCSTAKLEKVAEYLQGKIGGLKNE